MQTRQRQMLAERLDTDIMPGVRSLFSRALRHTRTCGKNIIHNLRLYCRCMHLKRAHGDFNHTKFSFGPVIDELWHLHVLDTQAYAKFCGRYFIHHRPDAEKDAFDVKLARLKATQAAYKEAFGTDFVLEIADAPCEKPLPAGERDYEMQFFVKDLQGKTLTITPKRSATVYAAKVMIYMHNGIAPAAQRLIYGGKQLEDGNTFFESKIPMDSTLHLTLRLSGC